VFIINNTVANNDSASSGINAFPAGPLNPSVPQRGAGLAARVHSTGLQASLTAKGLPQLYSNPVLQNNIFWHNRSFYFDQAANGGLGGLLPDPVSAYADLAVVGTTTPQFLNPTNCILTDTTGYGPTNIMADPLFVSEYFNTLQTASVPQEGGNFVMIVFKPLTLSGNYHLGGGASPAVDAGGAVNVGTFPALGTDFDGQSRNAATPDIGADEFASRSPVVDLNGDLTTDLVIYRSSTGAWNILPSGGGMPYAVGFGGDPSDKPVAADYDGDGITDIAIYRSGSWFIIPSSTQAPYGIGFGGDASDLPVPGDYDGDGQTDVAVYRVATGAWFILPSGGGAPYGVGFGGDASDLPVPGDYNGDGITDVAIYRQGMWFINPSGGGAPYGLGFGGDASDFPVPGDYDGDGITDVAIYRVAIGAWFILPSGGGASYGVSFGGNASDLPVPGDYDGDGITDIAIYRQGMWFINPSGGGAPYGVGFGGDASDIPVTANPALY
jgi:hypothetical protein